MTSLNHIPDHLRDRRYDDDNWTPRRAILRGSIWTMTTGILIGTLSCLAGYHLPAIVSHWALAAVGMFVVTAVLHAAMHHGANVVTHSGNAIAVFVAGVILVATYLATTARLVSMESPTTTLWASLDMYDLFMGNITKWIGLLAAAVCCKDGDTVLEPLFGFLSRNFLTGAGR